MPRVILYRAFAFILNKSHQHRHSKSIHGYIGSAGRRESRFITATYFRISSTPWCEPIDTLSIRENRSIIQNGRGNWIQTWIPMEKKKKSVKKSGSSAITEPSRAAGIQTQTG